jgi:hypothetical protein
MIWLSWRQQRAETVLTAALLALLAAMAVPEAIHLASAYTHYDVASCLDRQSQACAYSVGNFGAHAGALRSMLGWLNLLIGLIGVALAAPLILDLENGTATFAWTQSVTRGRWLTMRLGVPVLTALAAGGVYSLLLGWYRGPLDATFGPFSESGFDVQGIVPLAYVLFALSLGLAIGVIWRRTAPAMIAGFIAYFVARISVDSWLRQRFLTPLTVTWGPHASGPNLQQAWVTVEGPSNSAGHIFSGSFPALERCAKGGAGGIKAVSQSCLDRLGAGYTHAVYQPASRFWEFQGIEFALFAGMAVLLIAFAAWRVLRTD